MATMIADIMSNKTNVLSEAAMDTNNMRETVVAKTFPNHTPFIVGEDFFAAHLPSLSEN
jgi:hypothetical protein